MKSSPIMDKTIFATTLHTISNIRDRRVRTTVISLCGPAVRLKSVRLGGRDSSVRTTVDYRSETRTRYNDYYSRYNTNEATDEIGRDRRILHIIILLLEYAYNDRDSWAHVCVVFAPPNFSEKSERKRAASDKDILARVTSFSHTYRNHYPTDGI